MKFRILPFANFLTGVLLLIAILSPTRCFAASAHERVIHDFERSPDGSEPLAAVIGDSGGNLYGTTSGGGYWGFGAVFELSPPSTQGGSWTETVLYSFLAGSDGATPLGTLVFDKQGNLYGTTSRGGLDNQGTVFELLAQAASGGQWVERILYAFPADGSSGSQPEADLMLDSSGNLYGTTTFGGTGSCPVAGGCGTVFELSPPNELGSAWTETVLHNFSSAGSDGFTPKSGLVRDRKGTFYGSTFDGGTDGVGSIFQLERTHGKWVESVIYTFNGSDGASPATPTLDGDGNLYDTAAVGPFSVGVVFELSPPTSGSRTWTYTTLYSFTDKNDGVITTSSALVLNRGRLFGVANRGGRKGSLIRDNGTVFQLSPPTTAGGPWTETTLHEFSGAAYGDGTTPLGKLVLIKGKFFGTTFAGGPQGLGTVFSVAVVP